MSSLHTSAGLPIQSELFHLNTNSFRTGHYVADRSLLCNSTVIRPKIKLIDTKDAFLAVEKGDLIVLDENGKEFSFQAFYAPEVTQNYFSMALFAHQTNTRTIISGGKCTFEMLENGKSSRIGMSTKVKGQIVVSFKVKVDPDISARDPLPEPFDFPF